MTTGRPLAIRDKDCSISLPNFTLKPSKIELPRWQPAFFHARIKLSQVGGRIVNKLQRPNASQSSSSSLSFYAAATSNPFKPPIEHVGARINEEMQEIARSLPTTLSDPTAHPAALYFALKFQSTKLMLFRSFLHHPDQTIRAQAQEEVFSSAIGVTRLCIEGRSALQQITCGTISMILMTCAVALASYSKAHQGKESTRAREAREAFETLKGQLKCVDKPDDSPYINTLQVKNHNAISKLAAFMEDEVNSAPSPFSDTARSGSVASNASSLSHNGFEMSNARAMSQSGLPFSPNNSNMSYSNMMPPPAPMQNYNKPQQFADAFSDASMDQYGNYNFYGLENYNPEMEFGHYIDPYSEAFFAELTNEDLTITPEDWTRLLG